MGTAGGSGCDLDSSIEGASGWDDEFVEDATELAPKGSPGLRSDDKLPVPASVVGEPIGESGSGAWVGERGVVSTPRNGVDGLVEIGVLVAFVETSVDGFDTSPIPKDKEARNLSSKRDRGLLGSCTPPLVTPLTPVRAGLDERCACRDLRMPESAESANGVKDGMVPSLEFARDMALDESLSWEAERRIGWVARCSTAFRSWENILRVESLDARIRR